MKMLKAERQDKILEILSLENKIIASELSVRLEVSEDTIRRDIKELESCYLFYCYAKDLTIENYYSYVSNGDSIMITENEQWFIASEPVKNSHYMSNYFFTSKDDLLLEKFSVVT